MDDRRAPALAVEQVRDPAPAPAADPPAGVDPDERALAELTRARALFLEFISKAGTDPRYAEAVTRSRERVEDLDATIAFLRQGLRERP